MAIAAEMVRESPVGSAAREADPYVPRLARVLRKTELTELETLFEIALADGSALGHAPGQFVQVSIIGVGECPISICTSPTRGGSFGLCARRTGDVTDQIHKLRPRDIVGVRGPLGHGFDVEEMHGKDVLIIAGGLGLAPVRSLIQYVLDERDRFGHFHLLYGARSPADLLFSEDLLLWREDPRVNFLLTVDRGDTQWRGRTGVVTTLFSALPALDTDHTVVAVVGPPIMFKFAVLEILARGIHQKNVYCSLERRMKCGIGKCGHCQANDVYCCIEGPVFKYGRLKALREAIE